MVNCSSAICILYYRCYYFKISYYFICFKGSQIFIGPVIGYFYNWLGNGYYFRKIKSAIMGIDVASSQDRHGNHGLDRGSLNSNSIDNTKWCFDEWVDMTNTSYVPSLSEILVLSAIATIALGIFLFVALPETQHVSLDDMEDLYDVSEYDLSFGCCPHGKGAGYLGMLI